MFKLTANKEDVIKFLIFSAAMFIVVAIIIGNLTKFSSTGQLSGINPFVIFESMDSVLLTIVVWIIILLSIIFGSSSQ